MAVLIFQEGGQVKLGVDEVRRLLSEAHTVTLQSNAAMGSEYKLTFGPPMKIAALYHSEEWDLLEQACKDQPELEPENPHECSYELEMSNRCRFCGEEYEGVVPFVKSHAEVMRDIAEDEGWLGQYQIPWVTPDEDEDEWSSNAEMWREVKGY